MKVIFVEVLKGLMKERNINQVQLAAQVGIKQNTISGWLCNKNEPSVTSLWLLADFFGVSVDYLIGRKDY